jgi:hypothetical protein
LVEFYRHRETRLIFGGRILGEEASCSAVISHVWRENQTLEIKLLSDEGDQSWDRLIPLTRAEFLLIQMGDPEFAQFANARVHSVLVIRFPDGATMFLAEQAEG